MTNPDPKQIIKGEIKYTLDEFAADLKVLFETICKQNNVEVDNKNYFKNLLLILMLSAEEHSAKDISQIMNIPEHLIQVTQDTFAEQIEIARAIHMALILEIMQEYLLNPIQTLPLVNKRIQQFLKRYIP